MLRIALLFFSVSLAQSGCAVNSADPCGGECNARAYTICTCAPDDPCGFRNDGVCDDSCLALAQNPFNDTADCTPVGPCAGECGSHLLTACTCAPSDPCGFRNDGVCDDQCLSVTSTAFDDAVDCAPPAPCGGACNSRTHNVCTCAPDDPCGYGGDGVCDDACYAVAVNGFNDDADCVVAITDDDFDGLDDDQEHWFATTFSPAMQFAFDEQWSESYPSWLVEPTSKGVSIFYAISYYEDGGRGALGDAATYGDPEFVVVDLVETASGWDIDAVFLSAYYREPGGDASGWYPPEAFLYETTDGEQHPVVYVSAQEHAMFPSVAQCDGAAWAPNQCDDAGPLEILETDPLGNAGNPTDYFYDEFELEFEEELFSEWYFTEVRFCGWWVSSGPRNECALDGYAGLINDWLTGVF